MEALSEYLMFLLKLVTVVGGFMFVVIFIASVARSRSRFGKSREPELEVSNLNDMLDRVSLPIKYQLLSQKERKAESKRRQKERKRKQKKVTEKKKIAYVIGFTGDIQASQVDDLAVTISSLINVAKAGQEVILKLESAGGFVHTYGLAAAQLLRLKEHKLKLTVCVDRVAASGGYMMAAMGDKICAAPFAVVGSIGVIGQLPNIHEFLRERNIDIEQHTAGEYKRTLTMLGKNTPKGRKKFVDDLNRVHELFKNLIKKYRPTLPLKKVATGEVWFGEEALKLNLVDEVLTSDAYLLKQTEKAILYEIKVKKKKHLASRLGDMSESIADRMINLLLTKATKLRLFPNA